MVEIIEWLMCHGKDHKRYMCYKRIRLSLSLDFLKTCFLSAGENLSTTSLFYEG